jgi:hypothetical protein
LLQAQAHHYHHHRIIITIIITTIITGIIIVIIIASICWPSALGRTKGCTVSVEDGFPCSRHICNHTAASMHAGTRL